MLRQCQRCKRHLSPTEFHKNKSGKDGLNSWCKECRSKHAHEKHYSEKVKCVDCGKEKHNKRNPRCRSCAYKKRRDKNDHVYKNCLVCGKQKTRNKNKKCRSCAYKGRIPSNKTRELWSKQRKGRSLAPETVKKIANANRGRKCTLEQRTKMSNSKTGLNRTVEEYREYVRQNKLEGRREKEGKNYEYKQWATEVKKRDKYICQRCLKKIRKVHAHHIRSWNKYPKYRFKIENGICLCEDCHILVHRNLEGGFIIG